MALDDKMTESERLRFIGEKIVNRLLYNEGMSAAKKIMTLSRRHPSEVLSILADASERDRLPEFIDKIDKYYEKTIALEAETKKFFEECRACLGIYYKN